jgi:hypothetical protein
MLYYLKSHKRNLSLELEQAKSFHDIFALVQRSVELVLNESRAGLNLGIMDLGNKQGQFLGAFYPSESNIIVMNATPLKKITETNEELFKPYVYFVLLHEYLHSLGYLDEKDVRNISYEICSGILGEEHMATRMVTNIEEFFPYLIYEEGMPAGKDSMLLIEDLDGGMDYID